MTNQVRPHERREFTPWGWTASVIEIGARLGASVNPVPLDVVRRVNSKLWSHNIEQELGVALPGAATATTFDELEAATARACPRTARQMGYQERVRVRGA
jgi:hypothetical protein